MAGDKAVVVKKRRKPRKQRRLPEAPSRPYMTRERFARLVEDTRFEPLFDFAAERACHDLNVALAMAMAAKTPYYWGEAFRVINGGRS